jgi:hypothetical protein
MSDDEGQPGGAETPLYSQSPSIQSNPSGDEDSRSSSRGDRERPAHFTEDPDTVREHAQSPMSDTNVDSMLVRMLVKHIPTLCSRWFLSSQKRKSKAVDKDPTLKLSLQVTSTNIYFMAAARLVFALFLVVLANIFVSTFHRQIAQGPYLLYAQNPGPSLAEDLIRALRHTSDALTVHLGVEVPWF